MDQSTQDRLYKLLPAIYRARDVEHGEPLRALTAVLQSELDRLQEDIDGLYDDWFIETCAEWVIPYIGELLGVRNLYSISSAGIFSQRAYVANTLRYRRRKGTAPVLEQLARDVTGWPARAVEFFERLVTTQHMNHVRRHSLASVDLRHADQLALLGGPFETATHTFEARRIASGRGKYNIPNIGLFLWRLQSYFVTRVTPRAVTTPADGRYRFSPLGNDAPLFNRPQTESEITHLAQEVNVPDRLRRRALYADLNAYRQTRMTGADALSTHYFGTQQVLQIFFNGQDQALLPEEMVICDLSGWDVPGWPAPASQTLTRTDATTFQTVVAVDPELGRLAVLSGVAMPTLIQVSYAYGFSSNIGSGPYGRRDILAQPVSAETWSRTVSQQDSQADFATLVDAVAAWQASGAAEAMITIADSATYGETVTVPMAEGRTLVIQAADGQRPVLLLDSGAGDLTVSGGAGAGSSLTLNGLLIEGGVRIAANSLDHLGLTHCTLVPGRGLDAAGQPRLPDTFSIVVQGPNPHLRIAISYSIVGPLQVPDETGGIVIQDSVVQSPLAHDPAAIPAIAGSADGSAPGPPITLERVTVFGRVYVREIGLASESLVTGPMVAQRRQVGCTRFCYLPQGSRVPRRFRCQPDLALAGITDAAQQDSIRTRLTPSFTSERYGQPAYAQLSRTCAAEIHTGAEDGSEMGIFSHLKQPQRQANLYTSLAEYMRFGLEAGVFYIT